MLPGVIYYTFTDCCNEQIVSVFYMIQNWTNIQDVPAEARAGLNLMTGSPQRAGASPNTPV